MLDNRWFSLGLAAIALLLVAVRVVKPMLGGDELDVFVPDDPDYYALDIDSELTGTGIDTPLQGAQFDSAQRAIQSIDVATLKWDARPSRDPFSPGPRVSEATLNAVQAVVAQNRPVAASGVRWPAVSAVVDSRKHQYAVVDGAIRRIGDRFNGFRITDIGERGVHLVHGASRQSRHLKVEAK